MKISEGFKKFGAKQKNVQWSVSAINDKNELVVSLWSHKPLLTKSEKENVLYVYRDKITRWSGLGKNEFQKNLDIAFAQGLVVRAVLATLKDFQHVEKVQAGEEASQFAKIFAAKDKWIGHLILWDGENFEIEFSADLKGGVLQLIN